VIYKIIDRIVETFGVESAKAHCDIPCKIYDPSHAQISALTIIRLIDIVEEIRAKEDLSESDYAQIVRLTVQKEEHAITVKSEINTIWGDYFKKPQFEQFPDTHQLVHQIMMQASKCKQTIERDNAIELLKLVNRLAEYFWQTKQVKTYRAACPYPPAEIVVYPKLSN